MFVLILHSWDDAKTSDELLGEVFVFPLAWCDVIVLGNFSIPETRLLSLEFQVLVVGENSIVAMRIGSVSSDFISGWRNIDMSNRYLLPVVRTWKMSLTCLVYVYIVRVPFQ